VEDIRRMPPTTLVIGDGEAHGLLTRIPLKLNAKSRKPLWHEATADRLLFLAEEDYISDEATNSPSLEIYP
jgi:hypothetical protein